MNEDTRRIAERLERMQQRHYWAQLAARAVYALSALAVAITLVWVLSDLHELERDSTQRQQCIVELALLLADPDRDRSVDPTPPLSCEGLPAVQEE